MQLTTDLGREDAVPYFLWDEPLTVGELKRRLREGDPGERTRLAAKVLREARFDEAIALVPLKRIVADYEQMRPNLGRRRAFWDFLLAEWRALGLLP